MFPGGNFIVQMRVADTVQDARCMRLRDGVRMVIGSKSVGLFCHEAKLVLQANLLKQHGCSRASVCAARPII